MADSINTVGGNTNVNNERVIKSNKPQGERQPPGLKSPIMESEASKWSLVMRFVKPKNALFLMKPV